MSDETTQPNPAEQGESSTPNSETKAPEQATADEGKEEHIVPSSRLREEREKKDAAIAELETYKKEQDEKWAAAEAQRARDIAEAKFWSDIINHDKVKAAMEKYPTMTYDDAVSFAQVMPKEKSKSPWFIGKNPSDLLKKADEIYSKDLAKLPQAERIQIMAKVREGDVKLIIDD